MYVLKSLSIQLRGPSPGEVPREGIKEQLIRRADSDGRLAFDETELVPMGNFDLLLSGHTSIMHLLHQLLIGYLLKQLLLLDLHLLFALRHTWRRQLLTGYGHLL